MRLKYLLLVAMAAVSIGEARAQTTAAPAGTRINPYNGVIGTTPGTLAGGDALAAEIARAQAAEGAAGAAALPKAGGTMTGPLVLSGPPTAPLNPATKAYSDAETTRAQGAEGANATAAANAQATANAAAPQTALTSEATTARAAEGANATAIATEATTARNAANLTSGTVPSARIPFGVTSGTVRDGAAAVAAEQAAQSTANAAIPLSTLNQPNGPVQSDAQGLVTLASLKNLPTIFAQNFGSCIWDGAANHDVQPCIQAAEVFAAGIGGAKIVLPNGSFWMANTARVTAPSISIFGGGIGLADSFAPGATSPGQGATKLLWNGAAGAPMFVFALTQTPTNDVRMSGNDLDGISFDCKGTAGMAVQALSLWNSKQRYTFRECTNAGGLYDINTVVAPGGVNNNQGNMLEIQGVNYSTTGDCLRLAGSPRSSGTVGLGNTSLDIIQKLQCGINNGNGLVFKETDHIWAPFVEVFRMNGGTGNGVIFSAGDATANVAYGNRIGYLSTNSPIVAQGTESGAAPSFDNLIDWTDTSNATPPPTSGTGVAPVIYGDDTGVMHYQYQLGAMFADKQAQLNYGNLGAAVASDATTTRDTIGVWNSGSKQIRLYQSNYRQIWRIGVNSTSGNFEIAGDRQLDGSSIATLNGSALLSAGNLSSYLTASAVQTALGFTGDTSANNGASFGSGNSATNQSAAIGLNNSASQTGGLALGNHNTSAAQSAGALGESNAVSGKGSFALGRFSGDAGATGKLTFSSTSISGVAGAEQVSFATLMGTASGTTPQRLTADAAAAGAANSQPLVNFSAVGGMVQVVARSNASDVALWRVDGLLVSRGANAASTSIVGTPTISMQQHTTNAAAWTLSIAADTTNGGVAYTVTAAAGQTVDIVASPIMVEVQ